MIRSTFLFTKHFKLLIKTKTLYLFISSFNEIKQKNLSFKRRYLIT